jgi:hypothetical protein
MQYSIIFDDLNNYFFINTTGTFNVDIFSKLAKDLLTHPKWVTGSNCIFDYRNTDFIKTSTNELLSATNMHKRNNDIIGHGKSAFVMKDIANFGIGRMYQSLTEGNVDTSFYIFTDINKAIDWVMTK